MARTPDRRAAAPSTSPAPRATAARLAQDPHAQAPPAPLGREPQTVRGQARPPRRATDTPAPGRSAAARPGRRQARFATARSTLATSAQATAPHGLAADR